MLYVMEKIKIIKFLTKASSDKGYVYHLLTYTGKNFVSDWIKGVGATIIDKFSEENKNKIFQFIFDSYYSNLYSIKWFYDYNINFTCISNKNRKSFPDMSYFLLIYELLIYK